MTKRAGMETIRVIGVGNAWRGDDAVGLQAARRLRERLGPSVEVIDAEGDGLALLDLMEGADHVILIDAVKGGGRPGKTVRLDVSTESRWGTVIPCSTHAMGVADAIDLAGLPVLDIDGMALVPALCQAIHESDRMAFGATGGQ